MLLVANRMPVRACRGDGDEERLCSGIARAVRQNIPEFPVRLGVEFIEHQPRHVQPVFRANFRRQDLIESSIGIVHNAFGGWNLLAAFLQGRAKGNHPGSNFIHDGRLRAVSSSPIDFRSWFVIPEEQIQSNGCGEFRLAVFLWNLNVCHVELSGVVGSQDAEEVTDDLFLPRQQPEAFSSPFALGVPEIFNEGHGSVCKGGIIVRVRQYERGGLVVLQGGVFRRSLFGHSVPPPVNRRSMSSCGADSPEQAMMRLRAEGVNPNCAAMFIICFKLLWAMETCGTCCQ